MDRSSMMNEEHHPAGAEAARGPNAVVRRRRLTGAVFSGGAHTAVFASLFLVHAKPPVAPAEDPTMEVSLVDARSLIPVVVPPAPTPAPKPPQPTPPKAAPSKSIVRKTPAHRERDTIEADEGKTAERGVELSEAQIAGAASADSGPAGGSCDMARWLQGALRKDHLVQTAVLGQTGKAIMVWNGDWVQNQGQDGKGLAAVREAIMWEVAFAPAACKSKPVHGLVLLSLNAAPGGVRLAVGSGDWKWSDLLGPHRG